MKIHYRRNSFIPLAAALALLVNHATADTFTWDGGGANASWATAANWNGDALPTFNNTADIVISGTTRNQNFISIDRTIRSLTFDASNDIFTQIALSSAFTSGATSRSLTFSADSGNATLTVDADATGDKQILRTGVLFSDVNLSSSLDVIHNGSGILTFGGQTIIKGTGTGINKSGTGTLQLDGSNTYTGATNVTAGTLSLRHATDTLSSSSAVTVDGGTAILSIAGNSDTVGAVSLKNGGSITGTGGTLTGASYAVESGSVSAILGGAGIALTKSTVGTVTLSGVNTYTGATTITTGTLQLDGSTHASSTVGIGTAGILTGSGTVNGNATLTGGGIINKSAGSIAGTLGVTGGNWNGAGTVTDAVTSSSGTFTIGSGANLTSTAGVSATGGALVVNGTLTGTLNANSSTTVSGTGTITGNTTISGIHSPGNSPGIQSYGSNLSYTTNSSVTWELVSDAIGTRGTDFDGINVGGTLDFSGATTIDLVFNFAGSTVDWTDTFWDTSRTGTSGWLVYDVAGTTTNFQNLSVTAANWLDGSGGLFNTSNSGNTFSLYQNGNDIYLNYNVIPEPNAAALLGGLGTLMLLRRRR